MVSKWKTENPEREKEILVWLTTGDQSFTELYNSLKAESSMGWSTQTLTLYLKKLVQDGCVVKVPRGKREIYQIVRDNPIVSAFLGRVRIKGYIDLNQLSEGELLEEWLASVKFNLINVVKGYTIMGRGIKTLRSIGDGATLPTEKLLEEYMSDLLGVTQFYGRILVKGVSRGRLDPEKVLVIECHNVLLVYPGGLDDLDLVLVVDLFHLQLDPFPA